MTVTSIRDAWAEVQKIFPTRYEHDASRSERAGYPIYYSTASDVNAWISDLGNRLEVNLPDGKSVNIWIQAPAEAAAVKEMQDAATEGGEIKCITSLEGKQVPVDPDPVFVIEDGGPEAFLDDMGATITGRQATPEEERRDLPVDFVPHRRTCPWVDKPTQRRVERGGSYGGLAPAT